MVSSRITRGHILFFSAVLGAVLLGWRLRHALGIIYVSALFAVVLMPVVHKIQTWKIGKYQPSRTVAVVVLVVSVFVAISGFLVIGLPPVLHDVQSFTVDLPARIPSLVEKLRRLPLAEKFGVDNLSAKAAGEAEAIASYLIASFPRWASRFLDLITAMILCIYFMLEGEYAYYFFLSTLPTGLRERMAKTMLRAEIRISKWLLGQGSLMLILGVCSTIVFWSLHVRYFFLLGVLMGLFNLIPIAGGVITILVAAGVAALDSWGKMAGVFIFYGIYIQIENAYLTPRIMKTSVNLLGLGVLVALLCGTELAGVVGAMVSVPTAALLAVFADEFLVQPDAEGLGDKKTEKRKS